jgi:hypothetical protein
VPTSVTFKDRIKNFHKFSQPDRNQTWPYFIQQMVKLIRSRRTSSEESAGLLADMLSGKAQGALLNLTFQQRTEWGELVSARDFIAALHLLARKAYYRDQAPTEAAIKK